MLTRSRVNQFEYVPSTPTLPHLLILYSNAAGNKNCHIETTGPEIYAQTESLPGGLTAFICSTGTGGTLAGVTHYLKEKSEGKVQCWLADPPGSALEGYINRGTLVREGGSITEGIGQGRITDNLKEEISKLDGAIHIPDAKTIRMVYHLLDQDGLYLGASSAMNVVAAKELGIKLGKGSRVVTILCDGAYRYVPALLYPLASPRASEVLMKGIDIRRDSSRGNG